MSEPFATEPEVGAGVTLADEMGAGDAPTVMAVSARGVDPALVAAVIAGRHPGSRPTIKDVAALAGVSPSVAARAVNGTGYVGERARRRVLTAAGELGYVPNVAARYLKERVARAVGVLVDDLRRPADAALAAAVLAGARERGFVTLLADRVAGADAVSTGLQDFVAFGVAGVVVVSGSGDYVEHLGRYGIPTVDVAAGGDPADAAVAGREAIDSLTASFAVRGARS